MTRTTRLWLRHEVGTTERRAPLVPDDARRLVADGLEVTVEDSPQRIFAAAEYAAAGCRVVAPGSWPNASDDAYILGLKEPGLHSVPLRHRHVFFGHAYKGQAGAKGLLDRFEAGGGTLLDLEYLTDDDGRRVAAFGFWAGYVGAALAVLHFAGRLDATLQPWSHEALESLLVESSPLPARALVIGALGRSGRGARSALAVAGVATTEWDLAETRELDRAALLDHHILVNAVLAAEPGPPFLAAADLDSPTRQLAVISDVTCDVTSACNRLPVYDRVTDWQQPVRRLRERPPLDIVAIDNLPSLIPREASIAFSADLLPHLRSLGAAAPAWERALNAFHAASGFQGGSPAAPTEERPRRPTATANYPSTSGVTNV